ncbi:MAG: hypothetical protein NVSMB66_0290 [Candidatus Doudnabacteria bacterium]
MAHILGMGFPNKNYCIKYNLNILTDIAILIKYEHTINRNKFNNPFVFGNIA